MKILKIHKLKKLTKWHPIKQMSTKRNWIKIDNKINISDIRIMSYNLLASQYMSADFPRWLNEKQNLKIRTEKIKKLKEINRCLDLNFLIIENYLILMLILFVFKNLNKII